MATFLLWTTRKPKKALPSCSVLSQPASGAAGIDASCVYSSLDRVTTSMFFPSKQPTPSEYAVLVVASSLLFVVVGIIELVFAFQRGLLCLGVGVAIGLAYWLYRRLKD